MTQNFLLFAIFILTFTVGFTQTNVYHPFPESNATWQVEISSAVCCPAQVVQSWRQYNITGADTIIGTKIYKKIFNGQTFVGGYRQDIPNKKIYCTAPDPLFGGSGFNTGEYLLYDFALSVGDIFKSRPLTGCDTPSIVISIDSILIDNSYRKKINLQSVSSIGTISVIEGIGSEAGLLGHSCFEKGISLCYYQEEGIIFNNKTCIITTGVPEHLSSKQIMINPNPFIDRKSVV